MRIKCDAPVDGEHYAIEILFPDRKSIVFTQKGDEVFIQFNEPEFTVNLKNEQVGQTEESGEKGTGTP